MIKEVLQFHGLKNKGLLILGFLCLLTISSTNATPSNTSINLYENRSNPTSTSLSYFNATRNKNHVRLHWETIVEQNNYGFIIEKSVNGGATWFTIGFMEGHASTSTPKDYHFTDLKPSLGVNSYRLKQINQDQSFEYSTIETVLMSAVFTPSIIKVFPNPITGGQVQIELPEQTNDAGFVEWYDVSGRLIKVIEVDSFENKLDVSTLPKGNYFIKVHTHKNMWGHRISIE